MEQATPSSPDPGKGPPTPTEEPHKQPQGGETNFFAQPGILAGKNGLHATLNENMYETDLLFSGCGWDGGWTALHNSPGQSQTTIISTELPIASLPPFTTQFNFTTMQTFQATSSVQSCS